MLVSQWQSPLRALNAMASSGLSFYVLMMLALLDCLVLRLETNREEPL
jgi:hypothetical protein